MKQFPLLILTFAWAALTWADGFDPRSGATTDPRLPIIALEAKGSIAPDTKTPCAVRLLLPGTDTGGTLPGVVRIHGASSQGYPKKSFGVTLDRPVEWLGMPRGPSWVLNAAFVDRSLMRHKLSYDLFRSLSDTNAPRYAAASRFVEVMLNGQYQGAYLLMQRVDRAMLGLRSFDSNAPQHACLYKANDHCATFDRLGHDGYEQREPNPLLGEYWGPLDRFNRFVSSTGASEFFDPAKGISARLDLGNTIDFHLLVLLTSNTDGFDKNLILAREAPLTNTPIPRFFFVPWDYDATFGRDWDSSHVGWNRWLSNHLFDRMLTNPEYLKRFAARWQQLRQREFSVQTIRRMIDDNVETLGAAANRNAARWQDAASYYPDRLAFQEDVAQMKDWIAKRTKWLDQEIARMAAN